MKITLREITTNGCRAWQLDYNVDGKRLRPQFKTEQEARTRRDEILKAQADLGNQFLALSPVDRASMFALLAELQKSGMTPFELLAAVRTGRAAPTGQGITVRKAWDDFRADLVRLHRSPRYLQTMDQMRAKFVDPRAEQCIASVTHDTVTDWLKQFPAASQATRIDHVKSFLSYCKDRKWFVEHPMAAISKPEKLQGHIASFTVDQVRAALLWIRDNEPSLLAYFVIATFIGTRPEEIDRLTWADFDLDNAVLRIDAARCKDKRPRLTHLEPMAVEWLRYAKSRPECKLPWNGKTRMKLMVPLRKALNLGPVWPHDICRHTFGSNHVELHHSFGRTAGDMGNSEAKIKENYRDPKTPAECAAFWGLTVQSVFRIN